MTRKKGSDHYKCGSIEPIDYIQAHGFNFCEGNVIKYVTRHRHSGTGRRDLEKAIHYLELELARTYGEESEPRIEIAIEPGESSASMAITKHPEWITDGTTDDKPEEQCNCKDCKCDGHAHRSYPYNG